MGVIRQEFDIAENPFIGGQAADIRSDGNFLGGTRSNGKFCRINRDPFRSADRIGRGQICHACKCARPRAFAHAAAVVKAGNVQGFDIAAFGRISCQHVVSGFVHHQTGETSQFQLNATSAHVKWIRRGGLVFLEQTIVGGQHQGGLDFCRCPIRMEGIQQGCSAGIMRAGHGGALEQVEFCFAIRVNHTIGNGSQDFHTRGADIRFQKVKGGVWTARAEICHDVAEFVAMEGIKGRDIHSFIRLGSHPVSNFLTKCAGDIQHDARDGGSGDTHGTRGAIVGEDQYA